MIRELILLVLAGGTVGDVAGDIARSAGVPHPLPTTIAYVAGAVTGLIIHVGAGRAEVRHERRGES